MDHASRWIWRNSILRISKVFVFSTCARRQGSRSCTVRHTSGNGCCRREAGRKTIRNLDDSLKLKLERRIVMKKTYGVVTLVAMLMGATLLLERTVRVAAAAPAGIKNVVLVHGAFADGSGW